MSIISNFNERGNQSTNRSPFVYTCKQCHITKLNPKFKKFIEIAFMLLEFSFEIGVRCSGYDLGGHSRSNIFLRIHLLIFHISFDPIKFQIFSIDSLFFSGTSETGQNLQIFPQRLEIQSLL